MYSCVECTDISQLYEDVDKIEYHIASDHFNYAGFLCEVCKSARFLTQSELVDHFRDQHGDDYSNMEQIPIKCVLKSEDHINMKLKIKDCVYKSKLHLQNATECNDTVNRMLECHDCRLLLTKSNTLYSKILNELEEHLYYHDNNSCIYKCTDCIPNGSWFRTENELLKHYGSMHNKTRNIQFTYMRTEGIAAMQCKIRHCLISARYYLEHKSSTTGSVQRDAAAVDPNSTRAPDFIKRECVTYQPSSENQFNHTSRPPATITPGASQNALEYNSARPPPSTEPTLAYLLNTTNRSKLPNGTPTLIHPHSTPRSTLFSDSSSTEMPDVIIANDGLALINFHNVGMEKRESCEISSVSVEQHSEPSYNVFLNNNNSQSSLSVDRKGGLQDTQLSGIPLNGLSYQQSYNGLSITQPQDQRNCQLVAQQSQPTPLGIRPTHQQSQQFSPRSATSATEADQDLHRASHSNVTLVQPKIKTEKTGQAHETWINWAVEQVKSKTGRKITVPKTIYGYLMPDKFKEMENGEDRLKRYKLIAQKWNELSQEEQAKYLEVAARLRND